MKEKIDKLKKFLREVWLEVAPPHGKVAWPSRKMVVGSTTVVFIVVAILSVYIGVVDVVLSKAVNFIISR
ncbi:MAG: preprotein translocase subunit SecE [bacterium]|nr:preprotein translocase subunit SecE [bacterium]